MTKRSVLKLTFAKKLAMAAAGIAAVGGPIAIGLLNTPASKAQTESAAASSISYVASVKLNNAAEARTFSEYYPGGRFSATAITVRSLLRIAYRIQDYQLVGAPDWVLTKRYDIAAKVEDSPPPSLQVFLQTLLKDRFNLVVHHESRELPRFALALARSDGRLGPRLIRSDFDCAAYMAAPHAPPEPGRTPRCATRINAGALWGKSISMTQLATSLAPFVNRFTSDKTGLTGGFDVELTWTEQLQSSVPVTSSPDAVRGDSSEPSIFTAIREQLGLKLVPERGPVNVLVVDRAGEPSEN